VGFFDIVVIPLFHSYSRVFSGCRPLLTYVMRNYKHWVRVEAAAKAGGGEDGAAAPAK
jgi:hypothetical protein